MFIINRLTYKQVDWLLQWGGTALTLIGAVLTSAAIDPLNIYTLNAGTALWLVWSIRVRNSALIVVNAGLLVIYAGGIARSLMV